MDSMTYNLAPIAGSLQTIENNMVMAYGFIGSPLIVRTMATLASKMA
jgi:hypothetical protein